MLIQIHLGFVTCAARCLAKVCLVLVYNAESRVLKSKRFDRCGDVIHEFHLVYSGDWIDRTSRFDNFLKTPRYFQSCKNEFFF